MNEASLFKECDVLIFYGITHIMTSDASDIHILKLVSNLRANIFSNTDDFGKRFFGPQRSS